MFPKVFETISGYNKTVHKALSFATTLTKTKVVNLIKKIGLEKFLTQDYYGPIYDYSASNTKKYWNDDRISGAVLGHNAQCCSFVKTSDKWFLFPFTEAEFKQVGISLDDALSYIKKLNDLKVGFKYLYLGYSSVGKGGTIISMEKDNAHWFAVPKPASGTKYHYMYLHWIFLRYLVNSYQTGGQNVPGIPYYNFPRIFMYLIEDLGVIPWKAFMYTQAAAGWASYYSMCYTDYATSPNIPDLGITAKQFKEIWKAGCSNMNSLLTSNNNMLPIIDGKRLIMNGRHDPTQSTKLVRAGKMQEFVDYMDSVYYPQKKKKVSKAKESTDGKKKGSTKWAKKAVNK